MNKPEFWATIGRISLAFGTASLVGAWIATQTGSLFGLGQSHLFSDATVFSLLGIGFLIDSGLHNKKI